MVSHRGIFRILSNIYDEAFYQNKLATKMHELFLQESSLIDIWQCLQNVFEPMAQIIVTTILNK